MRLAPLTLSLQFAPGIMEVAAHRAVLPRHAVRRWLRHSMGAKVEAAEFTVRIVDAAEGLELNHSYRHKDYATNVLTFGYTEAPVVSADLVLCAPVVAREAAEQNKTLQEHYAHLIVHGGLHAQGWDHEVDAEAEAMEAREIAILAAVGFANPYA